MRSDDARKVWSAALALAGIAVMAVWISRWPSVTSRLWRLGGYPDLVEHVRAVNCFRPPLVGPPIRQTARRLLHEALVEGEIAAGSSERSRRSQHFLRARSLAVAAMYLLRSPLAAAALAGAGATGWLLGAVWKSREVRIGEGTVLMNVAAPARTLTMPELSLPRAPHRPALYDLSFDACEPYRALQKVAQEHGATSRQVSEALAEHPRALAGELRRALAHDARPLRSPGMSAMDLDRYTRAWQLRRRRLDSALVRRLVLGPAWHLRELASACRLPEPLICSRLLRRGAPPVLLRLREEIREAGFLTPLHERLLRILAAHADVPASIDHHDAMDGGLVLHVAAVTRSILADVRASLEAARTETAKASVIEQGHTLITLALAHDTGKPLCYLRMKRAWKRIDARHAQWSAKVLAGLSELHREHGERAESLLLAVRYDHERDPVPDLGADGERLVRSLRKADGRAVQAATVETAPIEHAVSLVVHHLPQIIRDMSVNRPGRGSRPDAFYDPEHPVRGEEIFLVHEPRFRTLLRQYIDVPSQRALSLWTRRLSEKVHPAWAAISDRLLERQILLRSVRGVPIDAETRLVTALIHDRAAHGLFPISLEWLGRIMGEQERRSLVEHWSRERTFEVRAIAPGVKAGRRELAELDPAGGNPVPGPSKLPSRCPACGEKLQRAGKVLRCEGVYRKACRVQIAVKDGAAVMTCDSCGAPLKPVFPKNRTPPFLGCADRCRRKPPRPEDRSEPHEITLVEGELDPDLQEDLS